jgi:predicted Zn-dependent peptidase
MRTRSLTALILLVAVTATGAMAQAGKNSTKVKPVTEQFQLPKVAIEQFKLANGLRVVFSPDNAIPVVSVAVYYDVGSRNERAGRTGFAHLFEHMMFQGSENVPKAAHFQYIGNVGGVLNGTTSTERTNYFEILPANQLPLALWLESDRMRSLKVTQENLDNQRNAVQEEKRLRYDNQPYINAILRLNELVFKNFANAHSTIGSMQDLDAASVADVKAFFDTYYAPNNAVLVITGDFDPKPARALVEKYFGTIPRQPAPPALDVNEPAEVDTKPEVFKDRFAPFPAYALAWKLPARGTADFRAVELGGDLLFGGESSRLYQRMVKGDESALQVLGQIDKRRGPSGMFIAVIPKPGQDADKIRATMLAEIKRLATEGPTAEEMEKLRNNLRNDYARALQSSLTRAQQIAEFALYDGDPTLFNTETQRYLEVTPEQIKAAVAKYLDTANRVQLDIVPAAAGAPTAANGGGN